VQPGLAGGIIVFRLDRLVVDVRVVSAEARDLLNQPVFGVAHELLVASIPQLVAMGERSRDPAAVGLDRVLGHELRIEGRQVAVPENDLRLIVLNGVHLGTGSKMSSEDVTDFTISRSTDARRPVAKT
jgi:hypothetical protein